MVRGWEENRKGICEDSKCIDYGFKIFGDERKEKKWCFYD